jgi:hypothetical protein
MLDLKGCQKMSQLTVTIQINAQLQWQLRRTASGSIIAECQPIGLVLEAEDEAEARSVVEEGLHYFFLDHFEEGTLERFLRERGWTSSTIPPRPSAGDIVRFAVPWTAEPVHAA